MNSPRFKLSQKFTNFGQSKQFKEIRQLSSESIDIKPWNSNRLARMTARMTGYKKNANDIFSLSNRNSNNKIDDKQKNPIMTLTNNIRKRQPKPRTAPHNAGYRKSSYQTRERKPFISQQMVKLGPVSTEQVLDDVFQENLQSINFYPQFRASIQQRKNLIFLKPYLKSTSRHRKQFNACTFDGMQKLKTELYKGLRQSQNVYTQQDQQAKQNQQARDKAQNQLPVHINTNRSVIQYMTQYQGQSVRNYPNKNSSRYQTVINQVKSKRNSTGSQKNTSISILRQKLRNKYKESKYADKIVRIKNGQGTPITIIQ